MDILIIALDILLGFYALKSIYRQSKIIVRGKYSLFSTVIMVGFAITILAIPNTSEAYIVLMSLITLVIIMNGVSGLATDGVIVAGLFGRHMISYKNVTAITLMPFPMTTRRGKHRVVVLAATKNGQQLQLVIDCDSVDELKEQIDELLPHIPVSVRTSPFGN